MSKSGTLAWYDYFQKYFGAHLKSELPNAMALFLAGWAARGNADHVIVKSYVGTDPIREAIAALDEEEVKL